MRAVFEGTASIGKSSASDLYKRFAKEGVPGYVLDEEGVSREDRLPDEFAHIHIWYRDIRRRAAHGQMYEPILLSEIAAYRDKLERAGLEMDPLDEELLALTDDIWLDTRPDPGAAPKAPAQKPTAH